VPGLELCWLHSVGLNSRKGAEGSPVSSTEQNRSGLLTAGNQSTLKKNQYTIHYKITKYNMLCWSANTSPNRYGTKFYFR